MRRYAAGALLLYVDPKTDDLYTLMQQRSAEEHEPLTWCVYGGGAEPGETFIECLIREVFEESGIAIAGCERVLAHRFYDRVADFEFRTFVVLLKARVTPIHSRETADARWVRLGHRGEPLWAALPRPLHSGMVRLIEDPQVAHVVGLYRPSARTAE